MQLVLIISIYFLKRVPLSDLSVPICYPKQIHSFPNHPSLTRTPTVEWSQTQHQAQMITTDAKDTPQTEQEHLKYLPRKFNN